MTARRTYLVAYDIRAPRRLARVAKALENVGYRLQFSVFSVDLGDNERQALAQRLRRLINAKQDDVRFYLVPDPPRGAWRGSSPGGESCIVSGSPAAALAGILSRQAS